MEMEITLKKLKSVWRGKAKPNKIKNLIRFNDNFGLKTNNSIKLKLCLSFPDKWNFIKRGKTSKISNPYKFEIMGKVVVFYPF